MPTPLSENKPLSALLGGRTGHHCALVSRNGHVFKAWPQLAEEIAHAVKAHDAVLDGEICYLEPDGQPNFHALLFRPEWPCFYAFDVLSVNGEDVRGLPLLSGSDGYGRSCRRLSAGCCISITSRCAAAICSVWHTATGYAAAPASR